MHRCIHYGLKLGFGFWLGDRYENSIGSNKIDEEKTDGIKDSYNTSEVEY